MVIPPTGSGGSSGTTQSNPLENVTLDQPEETNDIFRSELSEAEGTFSGLEASGISRTNRITILAGLTSIADARALFLEAIQEYDEANLDYLNEIFLNLIFEQLTLSDLREAIAQSLSNFFQDINDNTIAPYNATINEQNSRLSTFKGGLSNDNTKLRQVQADAVAYNQAKEDLDALNGELAVLDQELNDPDTGLEKIYQDSEQAVADAQDAIDAHIAANGNPVPKALKDALNDAKDARDIAKDNRDDKLQEISDKQGEIATAQGTLTGAATAYNASASSYNTHITTRNAIINSYNSGTATYNSEVTTHNQEVDQRNASLANLGISTIPKRSDNFPGGVDALAEADIIDVQNLPDSVTPPHFGTLDISDSNSLNDPSARAPTVVFNSNNNLNDIPTIPPFNVSNEVDNFIENVLIPIVGENLEAFQNLSSLAEEDLQELESLFVKVTGATIQTDAFVETETDATTGSAGGAGMSAAVSNIALNESNPALTERIFSKILFEAILYDEEYPVEGLAYSKLSSAETVALSLAFLGSTEPAASLIQDQITTASRSSIEGAVGLASATAILKLLNSPELRTGIIALLGGSDVASPGLVDKITAKVALDLALFAATSLGLSFGLPGLVPQLLANLTGLSPAEAKLVVAAGPDEARDVLGNPSFVEGLEEFLTQDQIKELLGKILLGEEAIQSTLESFGIDNADQLAQQIQDQYTADALLRQAGIRLDALNEQISADFDVDSLRNQFLETQSRLVDDIAERTRITDEIIARLSREISLEQEIETTRQLRDAILDEAIKQGLDRQDAIRLANAGVGFLVNGEIIPASGVSGQVLSSLNGHLPNSEILDRTLLKGPFASASEFFAALRSEAAAGGVDGADFNRVVSAYEAGNLHTQIVNQLKGDLGEEKAIELADRTLNLFYGTTDINQLMDADFKAPNSIYHLTQDSIRSLETGEDEAKGRSNRDLLVEQIREFATPSADTSFLIQSLQSGPTMMILNLAQGGSMKKAAQVGGDLGI